MHLKDSVRASRPSSGVRRDIGEDLEGEMKELRIEVYSRLVGQGWRLFDDAGFDIAVTHQEKLLAESRQSEKLVDRGGAGKVGK